MENDPGQDWSKLKKHLKNLAPKVENEQTHNSNNENDMNSIPREMETGTEEVSESQHDSLVTLMGRACDVPVSNETPESDEALETAGSFGIVWYGETTKKF